MKAENYKYPKCIPILFVCLLANIAKFSLKMNQNEMESETVCLYTRKLYYEIGYKIDNICKINEWI